MHNAEFSRRDFLRSSLAFTLSPVLPFTHHDVRTNFTDGLPPDKVKTIELLPEESGKDPLFNAATVQLRSKDEHGRGFLIFDEGKYKIATAMHVTDAIIESESEIIIPGVCRIDSTPERFYTEKKDIPDIEPASYYVFDEEMQTFLASSVAEKRITPLSLVVDKPEIGEIVGVPSHTEQDYSYYRYNGYLPLGNLLSFKGITDDTYNCRGDSGSPIMQLEYQEETEEILFTGRVYGVLQRSATSYIRSDGEVCFPSLLARAN